MARVKTARTTRARHKKVLKMAKGYFGAKSVRFRMANQAVMKSLNYAYIGRRLKKRDFRQLWIARINAATKANGISYSKFIGGLKKAGVEINRKMLSEIAIADAEGFKNLVEIAKKNDFPKDIIKLFQKHPYKFPKYKHYDNGKGAGVYFINLLGIYLN